MATKKKKKKKSSPSAKAKANRSYKSKSRKGKKNPGVSLATVRAMFAKKKTKKKGHRNPGGLRAFASKDELTNVAVVLGGVTVGKLLPPLFPASWMATDLARFLTTAGVSAVSTLAAGFFIPKYQKQVFYGTGAMALSAALNPVLRKIGSTVTVGRARASLRDFVRGDFPEPHNPIYNRMIMAGMNQPGGTGVPNVGKYAGRWN